MSDNRWRSVSDSFLLKQNEYQLQRGALDFGCEDYWRMRHECLREMQRRHFTMRIMHTGAPS